MIPTDHTSRKAAVETVPPKEKARQGFGLGDEAHAKIVTGYGFIYLKPESAPDLEIFVPEGLARHLQFYPGATFLAQPAAAPAGDRRPPVPPFTLRPRTGLEQEHAGGPKFIATIRFRNEPGALREFLGFAKARIAFRSIRAFGDRGAESADYVFEGSFTDRAATKTTLEEIADRCSRPVKIIDAQELTFHERDAVGHVSSNLYHFEAPLIGGRFLKFCLNPSPGFQVAGAWGQKIVRMAADFGIGNLRVDTSLMNEISYLISVECSELTNTAPITHFILKSLPPEVNVEALNGTEFVRLVPDGTPVDGGIAGRTAELNFLCTSPVSLTECAKKIQQSVNDALSSEGATATIKLGIDLGEPRKIGSDREWVARPHTLEHDAFRCLLDDGRFYFLGQLGKGGFGKVNEYLDLHTGKRVAGKLFTEAGKVRREEIEALKQATQPESRRNRNLVALEKVFYEDLVPVLIMERLDFCLKDHLDNPQRSDKERFLRGHSYPGGLGEFVDMALQLLTGLNDLHHLRSMIYGEASVTMSPNGRLNPLFVHRDISPGNIGGIIDKNDLVVWKLMDFGLVAAIPRSPAPGGPARGEIAGTSPYMSPQAYGGDLGPANDVFSLGIVFFQVLCDWHHPSRKMLGPNESIPIEVWARIQDPACTEEYDARNWSLSKKYSNGLQPDAESALREIILKMIALDTGKRYPDPSAAKASLHRWRNEFLGFPTKVARHR